MINNWSIGGVLLDKQVRDIIRQEVERALSESQIIQRAIVNAKQAALYLGVCEETLMHEVRQNKVPHNKLRGRYIFHIPTIEKWLEIQGLANSHGLKDSLI